MMKKHLPGVVLAGLLLIVRANSAVHHHAELAVVWPLYFTAILLAIVFALCHTPGTAPWVWSVINSVLVGLLAMNLVNLTSIFEPDGATANYKLFVWIGSYLGVSGILYVLFMSGLNAAPASESLAWVCATTAGAFCGAVFPDEIDWVHGVGVLLTEQLIFYFIWIIPRTLEAQSLEAWNIGTHKLGVAARPDCPVAKWRACCDGILWGASPFALAGSLLKLLTQFVSSDVNCHKDDLCAYDGNEPGRITMWIKFTGLMMVLTVLCATPLQRMIDSTGLTNIAGSTMLSGLTTSVSMCFLNVLRAVSTFMLCSKFGMCDNISHPVFGKLMVAYLATLAACGSAIAMAVFEDEVTTGSDAHNIMLKMQGSMGLGAGLAWYGVFDAGANSGALDRLLGGGMVSTKGGLAVLLLATIFPLYANYVRPANQRAQAKATADREAKLHQH
jgi:hypothetical protein